ncbi:MAG: rod shape-determining protein RodA [Patescibacteria group bacterium]
MLNHLKKLDWILITAAILLAGIGLVSIYSSSLGKGNFSNFQKQMFFLGVGLILMFLISFSDWRVWKENSYLVLAFYFIVLLGLLGLLLFVPEIRGIRKWYKIGVFSLDPIEFLKIILIILLAKYFSVRHVEMYQIKHILLSGFYIFLPVLLIFLQPDLGSVLILISLWIGILLLSGIKTRHFLILCFLFALVFALSWQFTLKDYQKERIITFVAPQLADPLGAGWSQAQAKIAIGSGSIFGKGFSRGSQTQYGFLPEPHTDFIFAAIAEEFGFAGVLIVIGLFLIILWRVIKIAILSRSNFPRLLASGFVILLITQTFIHIGMNLGILPIVGVPLPLVSYGGSSLILTFLNIGIIQSIKAS